MARKGSRRDFLRGASAADAVGDAVDRVLPGEDESGGARAPSRGCYAVHVSRKAMACEFEAVLNAGQYDAGTEVALDALDLVERLEAQLSYFRPESEVSEINRSAAEEPVCVEERLFLLLSTAAEIHTETDGAFDLTATPLWKAWGFARGEGRVPSEEEVAEALETVGGTLVELDADRRTVRFQKAGVELNLGSIGKGYALDRVAEVMDEAGIGDYLIQGGQSSVRARGSRLTGSDPDGWLVGLGHPLRPGTRLGHVRLRDRALGTSGSASQFFRHKGRRYSHIVDPRTGQPTEVVLSATVLAPDAARADALATSFFVLGREKAVEFCRKHPELAAILICPASGSPGFELHTIGLSDGEFLPTEDGGTAM
jgi:thiamine biosynthesis lipoprotein